MRFFFSARSIKTRISFFGWLNRSRVKQNIEYNNNHHNDDDDLETES